jgi:hypothetical protein
VPRDGGGFILRRLGAQVPHRVTHDLRPDQLFNHVQQTRVTPHISESLHTQKYMLYNINCIKTHTAFYYIFSQHITYNDAFMYA